MSLTVGRGAVFDPAAFGRDFAAEVRCSQEERAEAYEWAFRAVLRYNPPDAEGRARARIVSRSDVVLTFYGGMGNTPTVTLNTRGAAATELSDGIRAAVAQGAPSPHYYFIDSADEPEVFVCASEEQDTLELMHWAYAFLVACEAQGVNAEIAGTEYVRATETFTWPAAGTATGLGGTYERVIKARREVLWPANEGTAPEEGRLTTEDVMAALRASVQETKTNQPEDLVRRPAGADSESRALNAPLDVAPERFQSPESPAARAARAEEVRAERRGVTPIGTPPRLGTSQAPLPSPSQPLESAATEGLKHSYDARGKSVIGSVVGLVKRFPIWTAIAPSSRAVSTTSRLARARTLEGTGRMRWILAIVSAVIALMVGSLAGGLATSPLRNQALMDTASAFVGPLAFVYVGAAMAPLRRRGATIFVAIIVSLAVLNLAIRLTNPAVFEGLPVSVPIAQIAGAAIAFVLVRTRRSAVERNYDATSATTRADSQAVSSRPGVGQTGGSESRRRPELRWLGALVSGVGALVVFGCQIYVFVYTLGVMNATWRIVGVLALFFIPPLWFVTPFIAWVASGQFPTVFFLVWLGGWIAGGILLAVGAALRGR